MSDGDTPLGDVDFGADQQQDAVDEGTFIPPGTTCDNCIHQSTCAYYANAVDMVASVEQRTGHDAPIAPDMLALACDEYTPVE